MDGGTASFSQHDPAFEFNAPRWYDFQRLNECMPSPTADADAYFSSSQVKGLRTPTRDTEEGQDEDLGRMQEDLDRVRQEMRDEATSARRHSQAVSEHRSQGPEEPEEAEASEPEDAGHEIPPQLKSTPPAQAAETEGDAGSSPSSPALAEHEQEGQLTATPADEEASPLMQQLSAKDAAAQTGPQPWPLPPRVAAAQSAAQATEGAPEEAAPEQTAPEQALPKMAAEAAPKEDAPAQAKPRLPPSNLVTSWGPSAPARRIMAHTAPGPHSMLASSSGDKEVASSSASAFVKMPQTSSVPAASTQKQKLPAKLAAAAKSAAAQRKRSPRVTSPKEAAPRQADPAPQASVSGQPQEPPLASKSAARGSVLQPAKKPAGKAVGQRPLTKPKSPKLGARLAQRNGDAKAPERAAPKQAASKQAPRPPPAPVAGSKRLTRPVSPELHTSKRQRANSAAPTQQEQEEWRPLALMVAQFEAATPARFNKAGPRAMQYIPPPPRDPSEKPKACPIAPEFAVDTRMRPSHYKPQEERELDQIASHPAFKARPVDPAVMSSQGRLGVTHVPPKPPTTGQAPVLATEKRAAAHPKPAEDPPQPPLKPAAKFNPLRQTVAQSPKLATTARTRSQSMATAPEKPAFVFKARPVPASSGQAPVPPRAARSRRHTTSFQPFHLNTEERGGARQLALEEATAAKRAAEGRVPPFHAAPVPPTLTHPAPLPPVAEKPPTAQQPFNLISEARHHEAVVLRETQNESREAKRKRDAAFKAALALAHPPPRPPQPSRQPLTAAQTPDLALRSRSVARAKFEAAVAEKQRKAEEAKRLEAEREAKEDAVELKKYRRSLTFKAKPAPGHGIPLYDLSDPGLLQSPFQNTRSHSRLPR